MSKANWLKQALKKTKKVKKKKIKNVKVKEVKKYNQEKGAEFPIFAFLDGKKIKKIKNKEHLGKLGLHLGSVLNSVKTGAEHRGVVYSYNKSIQ